MCLLTYFVAFFVALALGVSGAGNDREIPEFRLLYPSENTVLAPTDSIVFRWSALYTGDDREKGKKIQIEKEQGTTAECTASGADTVNRSVFYTCYYHNAEMLSWKSLNWWVAANNQYTVVTHFLHPPTISNIQYEFAGLRPYVVVSFSDFGTAGALLNKKNLVLRLWTSKQGTPDFGTLMAEQEFDLDSVTPSTEFLIVSDKKVQKNTMTHFILEACVDTVCVSKRTESAISSLAADSPDNQLSVAFDTSKENTFTLTDADSETDCVAYFYSDLSEPPYILKLGKGVSSFEIPEQYRYGSFYLRVIGVKTQEFFTTPTYVYKLLGTTEPNAPTLFTDGSEFIRSGEHFFQWDLSSWGTSSKDSSYLFNVRLDVGDMKQYDDNTTSTFAKINVNGNGKAKLTITPIKKDKDGLEAVGGQLIQQFTVCDVDDFNKSITGIVYNKNNDETLEWNYEGDPKNFCNINGLWGFRVTLTTSALHGSTEYIVTNSTSLKIPKSSLFFGTWNATVDLFIAGEKVGSAGPTQIINITDKSRSATCGSGSPAFLNSFDVSRSKSSKTYPRPIELKWDYQELKSKCGLENVIVYMNGNPLAQIPTDIHGFTVPSHVLDPKISNNKFEVIIRSFYQGESTGRDVTTGALNLTVNDFIIVPPVVLEKPILGSENKNSNTKFEWKLPSGYPVSSNGFQYALFVGDSPDTMKQIGDTTTGLSMEVSNDKIPSSGSTYWTVKIVNLKDGQETVAAPPLSFLRFSGSEEKDPHVKVSFGDNTQPVAFSWDVNPFKISLDGTKEQDIKVLGKYKITASCKDDSQSETITLDGYSSTASFYELSSCTDGFKYSFVIVASDNTESSPYTGEHDFLSSGGQINLQMNCDTNSIVAPFTLSWTIKNNEWNCDCNTGSCKSHIFVSPSTGNSWRYIDTVPFDASLNGKYHYTIGIDQVQTSSSFKYAIVADNGYSISSKTCISSDGVCVPAKPLTPTIYYPEPVALNQPRNAKFCIVPLFDFNDCNTSGNSGKYQLWIRDSATREMNIIDVDWGSIEYNETGAICINHYVEFNIWDWTVAAVNSINMTSDVESYSIYDACEPLSPLKPIWNVSTTNFNFSSYHIPLSWSFPGGVDDDSVFGHYCMSDNGLHEQKTIYVYYSSEKTDFDNFDPNTFMFGGSLVTEHFREIGAISGVTIDHEPPLEKNHSFYFMVVVSNGARDTYSDILDGVTREHHCDDLECSSKGGICDKTGPVCSCYPDFEGDRCEIDLASRRRMIIAISVSVSAFVVLVVAAIIVYLVVRRYYKTHKALMMKRPEFEALRTPPMKMPSFPPDIDVKIDYDIVERALFGENGLVMIWDILKNTSATEIDAMAKALVYSFQKQNKALELMAFLIICEISESTSSTVLFRANSPATRAFKYYSKMYALEYLYKTLAVLLQGIIRDVDDMEEEDVEGGNATSMEDMNADVEEDDDDISSDENIGFLKIQLMSQKFFVQINRSDKSCPGEIKHICACLQTQLAARYPDFVYQGIGAFVFLRFYNTAITVPESYGLLPEAPRPSVRKQLLAVTKVLQNLANGVLFGDKEQNMVKLNGFITSQRPAYEAFLGRLCDASAPLSDPVPISEESYKASLATIVNQLFVISRTDDTILDRIQGITDELRDHIRKMKATKKAQPQE